MVRSDRTRPLLASLMLSVLLAALATSIGHVGLPALTGVFGATFAQVQWVVLSYLLTLTMLVVAAGKLGDAIGHRRLLLAGIAVFSTGALLAGVAPTLGCLVTARALQGMGAAIMMALSLAIANAAVTGAKTGSVMGLLGSISAVGTALGPALGGFLLSLFGWRALFLLNVPLGLAAFLLARKYLPADVRPAQGTWRRFDYRGAGLLGLALGAYALATTKGPATAGFSWHGALFLVAAVATGLLIRVEAKAENPLISPRMFRDAAFCASLAASALVAAVLMSTLVVGPFHLSRGLGLDATAVGLALAIGPLVAALTAYPAGRVVDRVGAGRMGDGGLIAVTLGSFALAVMPAGGGLPGYLGGIVVITAGYAVFQAANNTTAMKRVRPDERGVGSGLLNLSRNLGLITGASLMGTLFAWGAGAGDIATSSPEATIKGMRVSFAVAGFATLGALGLKFAARGTGRGRSLAGGEEIHLAAGTSANDSV